MSYQRLSECATLAFLNHPFCAGASRCESELCYACLASMSTQGIRVKTGN